MRPESNAFQDIAAAVRGFRRELHRRPELSGGEQDTREALCAELRALGFEPRTSPDHKGVVALWEAEKGGKNAVVGPCLALRADMDALPLREASGVPWASEREGVMHACGHDGHMAVLLGVARWLSEGKRRFPGPVKLIFQPAEETGLGAPAMIREGVLRDPEVKAIFGLHGWPELPLGTLAVPDRAVMAAVDNFDIVLKGVGGHGAMPHLVRDPVPAAAALIASAQTLVSRRASPLDAAVLTFGHVSAGKAHNVVPETCLLKGTLRTLDPALRTTLRAGFETMTARVAEAHGIESALSWIEACPATLNDPAMAALAREGVRAAFSSSEGDVLRDSPPSMGGEDFSYFLQEVPGAYFWLGLGMERGGLHNPRFDFNDEAIATGVAAFAGIVERFYEKAG
jgi:amidohydrolase